jgi:5-methylcytosine-specific restriction endonuclease McrBC GTP-binding regulatory subunit McrB
LARVEYYFADFLSLLESKRFSSVEEALKDNEFKEFLEALGFEPSDLKEDRCAFTSASIPLHNEDGLREPPKNLFLPPNLYFIGTVNVDETTHVFSPKVLDRAFTIEFDVGSFKDYVEEFLEGQGGNVLCLLPKEELQKDFIRGGKFTFYKPEDFKDAAKKKFEGRELYLFLDDLNAVLKRHGFPFGYRVFNEILIFIKNATTGPEGLRLSNDEALDRALLMKVLPKLYGTRKKLAPLIEELLKEILDMKVTDVNRVETLPTLEGNKVKVKVGGEEKEVESPFPLTVKKLLEMAYKLSTDGYASYM